MKEEPHDIIIIIITTTKEEEGFFPLSGSWLLCSFSNYTGIDYSCEPHSLSGLSTNPNNPQSRFPMYIVSHHIEHACVFLMLLCPLPANDNFNIVLPIHIHIILVRLVSWLVHAPNWMHDMTRNLCICICCILLQSMGGGALKLNENTWLWKWWTMLGKTLHSLSMMMTLGFREAIQSSTHIQYQRSW